MVKRISSSLLLVGLLLILISLVSSCSNNPNKSSLDVSDQAVELKLQNEDDGIHQLPVGNGEKTQLTISKVSVVPPFQEAVKRFEALHPEVEVVLHDYNNYDDDFNEDQERYRDQVTAQVLAGVADDLLDGDIRGDLKLRESGYMTDIYTLMQSDPEFNEDDYFMNVFEAVSYQGKLTLFPTTFFYQMYGVNNCVSNDFAARFLQYDTISDRQLLELSKEFTADSSSLYAHAGLDAYMFLLQNIQDYIDYENKTCDFNNPAFIQLLLDLKEATDPKKIVNNSIGMVAYFDRDGLFTNVLEEEALQYLFKWAESGRMNYAVLFPFEEPQAFVDFKPVSNEAGDLLIGVSGSYSISEASQHKELAWEFLKFLTSPESGEGFVSFAFPIHRTTFKNRITSDLIEEVEYWREYKAIEGDNETVVARQLAIYERILDMPMEESRKLAIGFASQMRETMKSYYQDTLTAEQVAAELQNKISLYLNEKKSALFAAYGFTNANAGSLQQCT